MSNYRIQNGDVVLICDGEKALFLRNDGDATHPVLDVFREIEQDNPPAGVQAANEPGRFNDGGANGAQRSAVEDTDWHELGKERFAKDIADKLYKMAHRGDYKRIIIAASPNTLGDMRKEFHKEVESKIVAQIDKDLTNHPVDEIEKILKSDADG